ncbi:MAG: flagellar protein FlgN, partial [Deltaproteobacteria bacterium]|nr:flagellar protein FlgN [Deltaproteobacteria bacterium]
LIGHLKREIELFKDLICVLHRETECIVGRDYKGLYETVSQKEHLAMRIHAATEARQPLLKEGMAAFGAAPAREVNLTSLIELATASAPVLEECQKTLFSLTSTIKEINGLNSLIIESSMANVAKTLGFLGNFMQPSTYKATGSFDGFAVKGSRFSEGA